MQLINLNSAQVQNGVGGKAASLGLLLRHGLLVPPGFVITDAIQSLDEDSLLIAFDKLNAPYVAVRSSAGNEDSEQASWAGQLETYLYVKREDVCRSVRNCAASANSIRAQAYGKHISANGGSIAVIVQGMINSEISGVAFSAHPVSGSLDQFVIEAGLGLGEAIVSGRVTPDTYVVNAKTGQLAETHISQQSQRLKLAKDGGTAWQVIDPICGGPKLSKEQLAEVIDLIRKVRKLYDKPVDIEWAFADDELFLLQARPITTLR